MQRLEEVIRYVEVLNHVRADDDRPRDDGWIELQRTGAAEIVGNPLPERVRSRAVLRDRWSIDADDVEPRGQRRELVTSAAAEIDDVRAAKGRRQVRGQGVDVRLMRDPAAGGGLKRPHVLAGLVPGLDLVAGFWPHEACHARLPTAGAAAKRSASPSNSSTSPESVVTSRDVPSQASLKGYATSIEYE